MCRGKGILLMALLGLMAAGPAMAFDFSVGVNLGFARHCAPPVVVPEPVYAPPVVVASPCYPVVVSRPHVAYTYVSAYPRWTSYHYGHPHGTRVVVRSWHRR